MYSMYKYKQRDPRNEKTNRIFQANRSLKNRLFLLAAH